MRMGHSLEICLKGGVSQYEDTTHTLYVHTYVHTHVHIIVHLFTMLFRECVYE